MAWLGPTENSFNRVGVMVETRFPEMFQEGWCTLQPPGKLITEEQAKPDPGGPGKGRNG